MEISNTSIGALAALCVVAGAGGAYLATRPGEPRPAEVAIETPGEGQEGPVASVVERPRAPLAVVRPTALPRPAVSRQRQPQAAAATAESASGFGNQPLPVATLETPVAVPAANEPVHPAEPEPILPEEPALPEFEELIVAVDSVVGLQVETSITSERARIEDEVVARVTRDVRVRDRVAIPAGARAHGEVTLVERGGRLRERARLAVRF